MGDYFSRGASAGGHDEGYFNREDVTGPSGVGSSTGGPGGVANDDVVPGAEANEEEYPVRDNVKDAAQGRGAVAGTARTDVVRDAGNPNLVRATPEPDLDETAGTTTEDAVTGTYPDIIEGSDSERTGTSWGIPAVERYPTVSTPEGEVAEGTLPGEVSPTRNTGDRTKGDELDNIGSWSTMDTDASGGSPSGNS